MYASAYSTMQQVLYAAAATGVARAPCVATSGQMNRCMRIQSTPLSPCWNRATSPPADSHRLPQPARCPPLPSCLTQPRAMTLDWEGSSETAVWAPRISTQSKVYNIKLLSYYTTPTRREKITCCLKQAFLVFLQLTYVLCANLR